MSQLESVGDAVLGKRVFLKDVVPPFAAAAFNATQPGLIDSLRFQYFSQPTDNLFDHLDNAAAVPPSLHLC